MSRLLDTYSRATGLRIDRMRLFEQFFPLSLGANQRYIVITTSSGMKSKSYPFFKETMRLLKPHLESGDYAVVQCGLSEDERIGADIDLCGRTTFGQLFYIIQHSSLVICSDTSVLHIAGHYNVPVVSVFGMTDPQISGAAFGDKNKQIYLEPDWSDGCSPSFQPNEYPPQIARIMPERVAEAVSTLINVPYDRIKTLYIGEQYKFHAVEIIPDHIVPAEFVPNNILNIRYDWGGEEKYIAPQVSLRKCIIVTNRRFDLTPFRMSPRNLEKIVYEIDENHDPDFASEIQSLGVSTMMISFLSDSQLDKLKPQYCDLGLIIPKIRATKSAVGNKSKLVTNETKFASHKIILSQGKIFPSRAHINRGLNINSLNDTRATILDEDIFWEDLPFFTIYNHE